MLSQAHFVSTYDSVTLHMLFPLPGIFLHPALAGLTLLHSLKPKLDVISSRKSSPLPSLHITWGFPFPDGICLFLFLGATASSGGKFFLPYILYCTITGLTLSPQNWELLKGRGSLFLSVAPSGTGLRKLGAALTGPPVSISLKRPGDVPDTLSGEVPSLSLKP